MLNFINNSIKFLDNGYICIILSDFDDGTLKIEIIHNGARSLNK